MLLLFEIEENLYAIDTAQVVEIVPLVLIRKVLAAPNHIAGVFNYHGRILPAIDLCQLIRGTPCQVSYSTRIVIVSDLVRNQTYQLGLMAERVTETLKATAAIDANDTKQVSTVPYLGEVFISEKGMIQQIKWQHLLANAEQVTLLAEGDQANGAGRN